MYLTYSTPLPQETGLRASLARVQLAATRRASGQPNAGASPQKRRGCRRGWVWLRVLGGGVGVTCTADLCITRWRRRRIPVGNRRKVGMAAGDRGGGVIHIAQLPAILSQLYSSIRGTLAPPWQHGRAQL